MFYKCNGYRASVICKHDTILIDFLYGLFVCVAVIFDNYVNDNVEHYKTHIE